MDPRTPSTPPSRCCAITRLFSGFPRAEVPGGHGGAPATFAESAHFPTVKIVPRDHRSLGAVV